MVVGVGMKVLKKKILGIWWSYTFGFLPAVLLVAICRETGDAWPEILERIDLPHFLRNFEIMETSLCIGTIVLLAFTGYLRKWMLAICSRSASKRFHPISDSASLLSAARYRIVVTVSCIATDIVLLFGLFVFLASGDIERLYLFFLVWAAAMFIFRPKFAELEHLTFEIQKNA